MWKNWSYPKRGGITALTILFLYGIVVGLTNLILGGVTPFAESSGKVVLFIVSPFVSATTSSEGAALIVSLFSVWILTPVFWVLVGLFIGWIIGKVKSKRQTVQ